MKVTPADGGQVSCFFGQRAIKSDGQFCGTEDDISLGLVAVSRFLLELKYAAECIVIPGIKCTGIHLYFFDKVGVEDALRTTSTSLGAKMIDDRDFNAIEVVYVFTGCTAPDNDIIPEATTANATANARQRLDYLADVEVSARVPFDLFCGHALYAQRGFQACGFSGVSSVRNDNLIQFFRSHLQFNGKGGFITRSQYHIVDGFGIVVEDAETDVV